ncbi:MAG: ExeM/NucH family extracellular endonuclease [Woeseiaceae bacterium]
MQLIPVFLSLFFFSACGGGSGRAPAVPISPATNVKTIAEIQGSGSSSPFLEQVVSTSGIVTGDFQNNDGDDANELGGFYIQQEIPDSDTMTSDGVFVFDGANPATDVRVGDRVKVQGTISEYFSETQITKPTVTVIGSGVIHPTDVTLPVDGTMTNSDSDLLADLERYEGMLLRFPQALFVSDLRNLERFGSVSLSEGGRLFQFTNTNEPDPSAYSAHKASDARRRIELDDGRRSSNPATIRYLNAGSVAGYSIRAGDTISGVTGNLRYSRGSGGNGDESWRLMPTKDPQFDSTNARPGRPDVGGSMKIASFNVLNFFSTVDSGQNDCGPQGNENCRGADSARELHRQLAKTVSALALMDADIVGLIELENNSSRSLQMIVDALNSKIGTSEYAFVNTGTIHDDVIKTGFIFKSSTIAPTGSFKLLDQSVDSRFNDAKNRPALAQSFSVTATGAVLTVIVNHLKSKGSSCDSEGDPNLGDGQGNCSRTRTDAAVAIADWAATDPTGSNDPDVLIIGDLNAYTREDPLTALKNAGLANLRAAQSNAYSFVFDAQAGALDHAIASASLMTQVVDTIEWHINADEPTLLDYNLEHGRNPALFDPDSPYRASDHDPVIIGFDLTN